MTNKGNSVLYTGVTSRLPLRVYEHRTGIYPNSFTSRYGCHKLVWFESFGRIEEAIAMEKKIKAGSRQKKLDRINSMNPEWEDLWEMIKDW